MLTTLTCGTDGVIVCTENSSANVNAVKPGIKGEGDISVGENCHALSLLRVNGLQNVASPQTGSSTTVRV